MSDTRCTTCNTEFRPSGCTTGYGEDSVGNRYCYECCGERDRADMIKTGRATLYHVDQPQHEATNWPGTLRFPIYHLPRTGRHNIAGKRYDVWFRGPDGKRWHGVRYGDNTQILHCRRTKAA